MKTVIIVSTVASLGVLAATIGCRSKAVSQEPDEVNAVIDKAVEAGADIPPSKRSMVVRMLRLSEKDLILGLRTFAELSGGRYPDDLETKSMLRQVDAERLGSSRPDLSESRRRQMLMDIFFASAFYDKLKREKRDVQYYGDTVGRQDAGKVLMRWTESKDRYKVVLGDLAIRTLSSQQLAELTM
ncbi:MAG: hypothetical protein ABFD90_07430 [Phycisphaerales bacterium]